MSTKPVNAQALRAGGALGAKSASRYATLARLLTQEIEAGRFKLGHKIPTEAQLQQRFDVSRHTVRAALRDLKDQGLIRARAGVGTVVRATTPGGRFMQGIGTLEELIQFVEATRMQVLKRRVLIVDDALASQLAMKRGQEWHEASVLRFLPRVSVPVAWMRIYARPEHSDVLALIDKAGQPVFSMIERHHGVRIAEVRQQIVAAVLDAPTARVLKARAGTPALHITREYFDSQDRLMMASVGFYPSERFSHNTRFRIQNAGGKGSP